MIMALSTSITIYSFLQNKTSNNNNSYPNFLPKQAQTSVNAFYKPPTKLKPSYHRPTLTVPAISNSLEVGSLVADETNMSMLDKALVFDLKGNEIPISDLWKDRKAVVAFARHFGCVLCRKRADYLDSKKEQMDAAGVELVLIGPGSIDQAKAFYDQTKFKGEVYADPNHSSYDALRFVSGVSTTFTPKAALKIFELYMEGYRQDWGLSFQKDTVSKGGWQQGGIIVAGPEKTNISYIHKGMEFWHEISKVIALNTTPTPATLAFEHLSLKVSS